MCSRETSLVLRECFTDAQGTSSSEVESAGVHSQAVTPTPPQAGTTFFAGSGRREKRG